MHEKWKGEDEGFMCRSWMKGGDARNGEHGKLGYVPRLRKKKNCKFNLII